MEDKDIIEAMKKQVRWTYSAVDLKARNPDNERIQAMPDTEEMFETEIALAVLLFSQVVFVNDHWWKKEWSEEHRNLVYIGVNCNDVFAWGCSDSEEATYKDLYEIWEYWKKDPDLGHWVWCIKKRNELPQKPVYDYIMKKGIWDLDSMGLEPNYYDAMLKEHNESKNNPD